MSFRFLIPLALLALLGAAAYFWGTLQKVGMQASRAPNTLSLFSKTSPPTTSPAEAPASPAVPDIQIIADNLTVPWEIVWLPDTSLLLTQRPGTLLHIGKDGQRTTIQLPQSVTQVSESGLLGLAIHPTFAHNQLIYIYFTTGSGREIKNRVVRYQLINNTLAHETIIVDNIPAGNFHDGGRIKFGPDNFLYVSTGDAGQDALAQNPASLAGKILRIGDGSGIPADNPFPNSPVYSVGHRNVQGLTWDSSGNLWATEHGRSGIQSGLDEVNLVRPGQNYGWPNIEGDEKQAGLVSPTVQSGPNETWAPSGAAFWNGPPASTGEARPSGGGSIFFAGLRGETLYEAKLDGERVTEFKRHFAGQFGRLRTVNVGPDGALYILTNNTDSRGTPNPGDDKLIRVTP